MSTDLAVVLLPEVLLPDLLHHVLIDIVGEVQRLPLGFKGTLEGGSELETMLKTLTAKP